MKKILLLLLAAAICSFVSIKIFAQAAGNSVYANQNNTGYSNSGNVDLGLQQPSNYSFSNMLEANVMINIKATAYTAIFSLTQHGNTIEEVESGMTSRIAIFKNHLQQTGIVESQIFVDPVSLVPQYEIELTEKKFSKTLNEVPNGFEMKKNVHITFKNHKEINDIVSTAAKGEVYDLVKVEYAIDNMDAVLTGLRDNALTILMNKKATMEKTGLHLRIIQMGEKYGSAYPFERYAQYQAFKTGMAPQFAVQYKKGAPQQQVQYNYAEKNKTIYYDKVSDKQFDMIINPVVGEPEVQVYFSMKAQFEKYNPETEAADKAYYKRIKELELLERELALEAKRRDLGLAKKEK